MYIGRQYITGRLSIEYETTSTTVTRLLINDISVDGTDEWRHSRANDTSSLTGVDRRRRKELTRKNARVRLNTNFIFQHIKELNSSAIFLDYFWSRLFVKRLFFFKYWENIQKYKITFFNPAEIKISIIDLYKT